MVDEGNRCLGLLSAIKIGHRLFPPQPELETARIVRAALLDVVQTFEGMIVVGQCDGNLHDYVLMVAAMKLETFVQRLRKHPAQRIVLIVGDREDIQQRAIEEGVRALIITGGMPLTREMQSRAEAKGRDRRAHALRHGDDRAAGARRGAGRANDRAGIHRVRAGHFAGCGAHPGGVLAGVYFPGAGSPSGGWWACLRRAISSRRCSGS